MGGVGSGPRIGHGKGVKSPFFKSKPTKHGKFPKRDKQGFIIGTTPGNRNPKGGK